MRFASALVPGATLYAGLCESLIDAQMVELASKKFVCIVDESKLVDGLGGSKGKSQTHLDAPSAQPCSLKNGASLLKHPSRLPRRFADAATTLALK